MNCPPLEWGGGESTPAAENASKAALTTFSNTLTLKKGRPNNALDEFYLALESLEQSLLTLSKRPGWYALSHN